LFPFTCDKKDIAPHTAAKGLSGGAGANVSQSSLTGSHLKAFFIVEDTARRWTDLTGAS
jgi:hypothetical protein